MAESSVVVIDNGSSYCRVGFNQDQAPKYCIPAMCSSAKIEGQKIGIINNMGGNKIFVGNKAIAMGGVHNLRFPTQNGQITNWYDMESIWQNAFYEELQIQPDEHTALFTEASQVSNHQRERMTQILLEQFSIPRLFLANQAVLSLISSGRNSGIVVHSGEGVTYTVPIYEGSALNHTINRIDLGGRASTDWLATLFQQDKGKYFTTYAEKEIVRVIKESHCYVAFDYEAELQRKIDDTYYKLPDGNQIFISNQSFRCPELLFQPSLVGIDSPGIHELTFKSLMKCDSDIRQHLSTNIVVAGGNSMFRGMVERLQKEVTALCPPCLKIQVDTSPKKNYSEWVGGSILASLSTFQNMCVSQAEYNEYGASIIHRKC